MNTPDKNRLLDEILGGDELTAFRNATLACGLDALRRRTLRRRQFQATAIMAALLVLAMRWHSRPAAPLALETAPPPAPLAESGKITYISEKELFALFPNRPIALVGRPGHQQFLILDEVAPTREQ